MSAPSDADRLRQSEALLANIQAQAHIGSWTWDFRADRPVWTAELFHIFGRDTALPPAGLKEVSRYFTEKGWSLLSAAVEHTLASGEPYALDVGIVREDGSRGWVNARGEAVRDAAGEIVELRGTVQDITERKLDEDRLRYWGEAFRNANFGLAVSDIGTDTLLMVNPCFAAEHGYTEDELTGTPILRLFPEDLRPLVASRIAALDVSGHDVFESEHLTKDGRRFPILLDVTSLKDSEGRPSRRITYALDISERKRIEGDLREEQAGNATRQREARIATLNLLEDAVAARSAAEATLASLRASEEKFRLLAENASDWIFWLTPDGSYRYVSPACTAITGHPPQAFLDDAGLMLELLHPDDRQAYLDHLERTEIPADEQEIELRIRHRDGGLRWLSHHCRPMYDEAGKLLGRRGANRDITLRKEIEDRRNLLSEAIRQTTQPLLLADPDNRITYCNPAFSKLFGYTPDDLTGKEIAAVIVPPEATDQQRHQDIVRHANAGQNWSGEVRRLAKDGTTLPVFVNVGDIRNAAGQRLGYIASYIDLRQLREKEASLRKLAQAVEQSPESIIITDTAGNIEYVNTAFTRNAGYRPDEVLGRNPSLLQSGKTAPRLYHAMWERLNQGQVWEGDFLNRRKDGSLYTEHAIISPIRDPDGRVTHYVAVQQDITEQKQQEEQIHRLAFFDPLTELPNRAWLLERLTQLLAIHHREPHRNALLLLNIDNFKTINDAGGPTLGDALLKAMGERLTRLVYPADRVARLSGDEFGILLTNLSQDPKTAAHQALHAGEKVMGGLREPFLLEDQTLSLTAGIGITLMPEHAHDSALDVIRRCDTALHHAKGRGTAQITFFDASLEMVARQRFDVEQELRRALANDELRVYLQSQVTAGGTIVGAEALVRWQHPEQGIIPPGKFIPVAEDSDLIIRIGEHVLTVVCRMLAQPDMACRPLRVSVNISTRHFRQPDFVTWIQQVLADTGADPSRLTLEITESLVIDNLADIAAKMAELSLMGIHFSMDDFGTGYSSLAYLKRLPIHELKIDKTFVQDAPTDPSDAALVEIILSVASHLHLKIVAEGVETPEQADFLNRRGQVIHQGYLFGMPLPLEEWVGQLPPLPAREG